MSLPHLLIGAAIGAGINITLGSRRIGFGNWQYWAIHSFVVCAIFLGGVR